MKVPILILILVSITTLNCLNINSQNFIATKNSKLFALGLTNLQNIQPDNNLSNTIWISNDQQSLKIQIPVLSSSTSDQYLTQNYTEYFPIFFNNITQKGYLKPHNPFTTTNQNNKLFFKGYKYLKSSSHDQKTDQTLMEIQHFLQNLIKQNNLSFLNLRMEDSFQIQITKAATSSQFTLNSLRIKYLFSTVQKQNVPSDILSKVGKNSITHENYLKNQKRGNIQRKLTGKGLHQWINTTISLKDEVDILIEPFKSRCFYQFIDILPESTYIDSDQRRKQTSNYQVINIQRPAFASKQYFYKFRVPISEFGQTGVHKYSYQQPVHFRYPAPSTRDYTKIYLHPIEDGRIVCDESNKGQRQSFEIYQLKQNNLFQRGTAKIPHADPSMSKAVSIVTLSVCLIAVLIITKNLKKP